MDPDSPDSQTCVLSPERAGPGVHNRRHRKGPRAARPPPQRAPGSASLPPWGNGLPAAFMALRLLLGGLGSPVTCSGLSRLVSRGSGCIYSRGRQASLLFSSGSEVERMVSVWRRCFAGVRHRYICVRITEPTDWWLLWRGRPDGQTRCWGFS